MKNKKQIRFEVSGLPPKKDGANSMWRKKNEIHRLKLLRKSAHEAMAGIPLITTAISLNIHVYSDPNDGDLDNFVTGICDGLMAKHERSLIREADWIGAQLPLHPSRAVAYSDDKLIVEIRAHRSPPGNLGKRYKIEIGFFDLKNRETNDKYKLFEI